MNEARPAFLELPADTGPWLVADIGGTNARLGWVAGPGAPIEHVETLPVAGHARPQDAVQAYLAALPAPLRGLRPKRAAVAVATATGGDEIAFTNSPWRFSVSGLRADLGLERLLVLNDFEALALSLPRLGPSQVRAIGPALSPAPGTLAVIGPGTGLGVGAVTPCRQGWVALPGEGGHATLAPTDEFESAVLAAARSRFTHVSAERLLSGIGLPVLHAAVADALGQPTGLLAAEQIVERGLSGDDALCARALDTFCAMLGSFAGSVALTMGARGGVYVGGGIVPRLGDFFFASRFRERFEAKGRFRDYLAAIPTVLITDTLAALTGAAFAIEQDAA